MARADVGRQGSGRCDTASIDNYYKGIAPKTRRTREQVLKAFVGHVGNIRVSKLARRHVTAFVKATWSASTIRSAIKAILACLNRAVRDGLIAANPVKDIEKPAWERREKVLTADELAALLAAAREPFKTVLWAMAETGCRPSEICGLKVEECFPDDKVWLVDNKTRGKTGVKKVPIYLAPELVELTKKLIGVRSDGHVFLNRYGDPWPTDTVRCRFVRLRRKLGLSEDVIPYGTHTRFVSDAVNVHKMDSLIVARLVGHSDARMLQKYYFREDANAMADAMRRAKGK